VRDLDYGHALANRKFQQNETCGNEAAEFDLLCKSEKLKNVGMLGELESLKYLVFIFFIFFSPY